MKKIIKITIFVVVIVLLAFFIKDNYNTISNKVWYVYRKYLEQDIKQDTSKNEYSKNENYMYVKINNNTTLRNKEDAKNMIYTFLDKGLDKYMAKCDPDYLTCSDDIKSIVQDNALLTDISNYVHPFNTFNKVNTTFTSSGRITLKKERRYTDDKINEINKKIDEIYKENYDPNKNIKDNIKLFHDYIINHTKYDKDNKTGVSNINSSTAYGVLFDGIGICSGYTDTMQLFLEKMNVKNYRISSNTHVWNFVYIEGKWRHIDLTWDDPIMSDGSDSLKDDYFMIDTNTLLSKEDNEHNFNKDIYKETN